MMTCLNWEWSGTIRHWTGMKKTLTRTESATSVMTLVCEANGAMWWTHRMHHPLQTSTMSLRRTKQSQTQNVHRMGLPVARCCRLLLKSSRICPHPRTPFFKCEPIHHSTFHTLKSSFPFPQIDTKIGNPASQHVFMGFHHTRQNERMNRISETHYTIWKPLSIIRICTHTCSDCTSYKHTWYITFNLKKNSDNVRFIPHYKLLECGLLN